MKKGKKIIIVLIFLFFINLFIVSSVNIIEWIIDNNHTKQQTNNINKKTKIIETIDNDNTEIIDTNEDKDKLYWDYIKMNLINVDFNELKKTNSDTVGWIQVNGTNVNYPFVQTNNNEYYLNHQFDKKGNGGGWIFMDYRNNPNTYDKNTILYGHGRQNNTMFGSLKNILSNGWLNNSDNFIIKLSTPTENTLWQVFSVYKIPTTSDYLQINFVDNEEFLDFANMLKNRSEYDFNTSLNEEDKIITLSTCYNNDYKLVVHAKLIKRESR